MEKKAIESIFIKWQAYLTGMCQNGTDLFENGFGHCLKKMAVDFGLNPESFGTPREEDDE